MPTQPKPLPPDPEPAYAVLYQATQDGRWSATLADLPEIAVTGADIDEVKVLIARAAKDHLDDLREAGLQVPHNRIVMGYVRPDRLMSRKEMAEAAKARKAAQLAAGVAVGSDRLLQSRAITPDDEQGSAL